MHAATTYSLALWQGTDSKLKTDPSTPSHGRQALLRNSVNQLKSFQLALFTCLLFSCHSLTLLLCIDRLCIWLDCSHCNCFDALCLARHAYGSSAVQIGSCLLGCCLFTVVLCISRICVWVNTTPEQNWPMSFWLLPVHCSVHFQDMRMGQLRPTPRRRSSSQPSWCWWCAQQSGPSCMFCRSALSTSPYSASSCWARTPLQTG